MAFWRRWFAREAKAMTSADLAKEMLGAAGSRAGVMVTRDVALQCGVAFACARVIADGLSQVPFRLMRKSSEDRIRVAATEHPLSELFDWQPNEWQTSTEFVEQIALHLAFCNNAYVWKNIALQRVGELLPLEPNRVRVRREATRIRYWYTPEGKTEIELPAHEVWHLRGPSWNGWQGLDAIRLAREAIGLSLAAESHGAASFSNGVNISGILTTEASLTKEQRAAMRESFMEVHGGTQNAGRVAMMSNGVKFVGMTANNVDSQWVESRKFQIEEICRYFRVMPIMLGYSDKTATYASAEQMFLAHVVHTLTPWYTRIEKSAAVNLLTAEERRTGYYFKFFTQALMRGAAKDRAEYYAKRFAVGSLSPNDIRELEDENPYEGGDQYRVPLNTVDPAAEPQAESAAGA